MDALVEQYETQPSKEATAFLTRIKQNLVEKERLEKQSKEIEKQLEQIGFQLTYNDQLELRYQMRWNDEYRHSWKEYFVPELSVHSKTTADMIGRMEALGRQYALKIWAGDASAEVDLFQAFEQELAKLNAENPA